MSFFSSSSGKRHNGHKHQGSNYYKREGLLSRILKVFGLFSKSSNKYNNHNYSHKNHYSDQRHYSGRSHRRRKYKSSWS